MLSDDDIDPAVLALLKVEEEAMERERNMDEVELIAAGYEWYCPDEECECFNREIEITETVVCDGCGKTFKVSDAYHAHG